MVEVAFVNREVGHSGAQENAVHSDLSSLCGSILAIVTNNAMKSVITINDNVEDM